MKKFAEEVERRRSERRFRQTLSPAQRYILDKLQRSFNGAEEVSSMRGKINALAETFRSPLSNAVQRELRQLRKRKLGREEHPGGLRPSVAALAISAVTVSCSLQLQELRHQETRGRRRVRKARA